MTSIKAPHPSEPQFPRLSRGLTALPRFIVSREEMKSQEEVFTLWPVVGTGRCWLHPCPFSTVITAPVPGATLLLRLCLSVLILHFQIVPSLQFSNLDRPGYLGEEGSFFRGSLEGIPGTWRRRLIDP